MMLSAMRSSSSSSSSSNHPNDDNISIGIDDADIDMSMMFDITSADDDDDGINFIINKEEEIEKDVEEDEEEEKEIITTVTYTDTDTDTKIHDYYMKVASEKKGAEQEDAFGNSMARGQPSRPVTVEDALSSELMKLSMNHRSAMEEEIHGVSCFTPFGEETSELITKSLYQFDIELLKVKQRRNNRHNNNNQFSTAPLPNDDDDDVLRNTKWISGSSGSGSGSGSGSNSVYSDHDRGGGDRDRRQERDAPTIPVPQKRLKTTAYSSPSNPFNGVIGEDVIGTSSSAPTSASATSSTPTPIMNYNNNLQKYCYLNDPTIRLRFLRSEFFDSQKAVDRFVAFLEFTKELFGDFVSERPISVNDFNDNNNNNNNNKNTKNNNSNNQDVSSDEEGRMDISMNNTNNTNTTTTTSSSKNKNIKKQQQNTTTIKKKYNTKKRTKIKKEKTQKEKDTEQESSIEMKTLLNSRQQYLPFRDRSGRRVTVFCGKCLMDIETILRYKIITYQHWVASEDIETQQKGVVMIVWPSIEFNSTTGISGGGGFNSSSTSASSSNLNTEQESVWEKHFRQNLSYKDTLFHKKSFCVPIRFTSVHFCGQNKPAAHIISSIFYFGLPTNNIDLKSRYKSHFGEPIEVRYQLQGYGIPVDLIPLTFTGVVKTTNHSQWVKFRKKIEHAKVQHAKEKQQHHTIMPSSLSSSASSSSTCSSTSAMNVSSLSSTTTPSKEFSQVFSLSMIERFVECPGSYDVIFRKGKSYGYHLGNSVFFKNLMESTFREYRSYTTQHEKVQLTWRIVHEVVERRKGRFLDWDRSQNMWIHITDKQKMREKVAQSYKVYAKQQRRFLLAATTPISSASTTTTTSISTSTSTSTISQQQQQHQQHHQQQQFLFLNNINNNDCIGNNYCI